MDSLHFFFDGVPSTHEGIYLVNTEGGMGFEPFLARKEIISETIPNNSIPYIYEQRSLPLEIPLTLSLLDQKWSFEKRRKIARWLDNGKFNEFYTAANPSKRYYVLCIDSAELYTNDNEQGYVTLRFQNISPYTYSPMMTKIVQHHSNTAKIYEFHNLGDSELYPELTIKKIDRGNLTIKNLANRGKVFAFTDLTSNESLYVDNLNRQIETNLPLTSRYDHFNHEYLYLVPGINRLQVEGKCDLTFKFQFTFKG